MNRRIFLAASGTAVAAAAVGWAGLGRTAMRGALTDEQIEAMQQNWREFLPEGHERAFDLARVEMTADQWREQLGSDLAYNVLRKEATERAGTHPYNVEKRPGVFACAGCELPLFTSEMKYDSGTGWPSYFAHIPGHLGTKKDFKLVWPRTEYHCIRCEGHQGHVFDDGPPPTGKRFCNNGVALTFVPRDS
ncbi:MAG: peptide-methionine (R)-S-oxide reductase MsrB [Pseudomonadota bacterium]